MTDSFLKILLAAAVALIVCAGCQTSVQNRTDSSSGANALQAPTNKAAKSESSTSSSSNAPRTIVFESPDKTGIVSTFYQSARFSSPAVLLLHQWGENRASFDGFAKRLQAENIGALAIDGRGFGESIKQGDKKIAPERTDAAVKGMLSDISAALEFLAAQPNVDAKRIGIVGASYGSSLAIIHAGDDANVKVVALLSPGTNYFGNLPTAPAVARYGARPLLLVAAEDDKESADAARKLDEQSAGDKHRLKIFARGGHGTGILQAGVGLEDILASFLADSFQ